VGDVEEDAQHACREDDGEQLGQTEHAEERRNRDRGDQQGPPGVRGDQHRAVADAVAPHADLQAEHQVRQGFRGPQQGDLEDRRPERRGREQGHRQDVDPAAELADEVGEPKPPEVRVPQYSHESKLVHARIKRKKVESTRLTLHFG
jgi:hypothetical protein